MMLQVWVEYVICQKGLFKIEVSINTCNEQIDIVQIALFFGCHFLIINLVDFSSCGEGFHSVTSFVGCFLTTFCYRVPKKGEDNFQYWQMFCLVIIMQCELCEDQQRCQGIQTYCPMPLVMFFCQKNQILLACQVVLHTATKMLHRQGKVP